MLKRTICSIIMGLVIIIANTASSSANESEQKYQKLSVKSIVLIKKYERELGFHADPFAYIFDSNEANSVYDELLTQEGDIFCEESNLFKIKTLLLETSNIDLNKIEQILENIESSAKKPNLKPRIKQSNLLALKTILEQLHHFTGDFELDENSTTDQQDEQKQEQEQDWPPELNDKYKPHTKDLPDSNSDEEQQQKHVLAKTNFKTLVFGQITYDSIIRGSNNPFSATDLPWQLGKLQIKTEVTDKHMTVYPLGKQNIKLFMPTGYIPGQPDLPRASIKPEKKGGYRLYLTQDYKEVKIPLYTPSYTKLSNYLKDVYTKPVGLSANELPEKAQAATIHKFNPKDEHNHNDIAQAVTNHIAKNYLYSSGARPETDPIAALEAGAFQCDMAAYIMVSILRDIYKIPSRAVAGYRAKKANNNKEVYSYLISPEEGHAWVEVFIDGNWKYFDPTPIKKDKEKDEDNKKKQKFSDWDTDNDNDLDKSNNEDKDQQNVWENNGDVDNNEKQNDSKNASKDSKDKENKKYTTKSSQINEEEEDPYFAPELVKNLADLLNNYTKDDNPFKKLAWQDILTYTLNPLSSSYEAQNNLHAHGRIFDNLPNIKNIISEAKAVHQKSHPQLVTWIESLSSRIFSQNINNSYKDLQRIMWQLRIYLKVSDKVEITKTVSNIEKSLQKILDILDKLNSEVATDIAISDDFKNSSPNFLWKSVRDRYDLNLIGPNVPTQNLSNDIKAGKLNNEKLINALYGHTDFILDSTPKTGKINVKTWEHASLTRGPDILPLDRFSDWRNSVLLRPDLDIVGNMETNTAYHMTNRKTYTTDSKKQLKEPERITIVGFDTSGSMMGGLADFQTALITAFACRAIDDISDSGKHRHKVILVPFDHKVHEPIRINNKDDLLNLIGNYKSWLRNRGGGTDIQAFLIQAMALIADSQNNNKNPFDIANIIVMSDGQSSLNYEELKKARQDIHRDTPLQTMFIALGESNDELKQFAKDTKKIGMNNKNKQDLYRFFSHQDISNALNNARNNDVSKYKDAFYSSKKPSDISNTDKEKIIKLFKSAIENSKSLKQKIIDRLIASKKPEYHKRDIMEKTTAINKSNHQDRKIEGWIHEFREWLDKYSLQKENKLFDLIIDSLVLNFETTVKTKFETLSHFELEQLNHLLKSDR